MTYEEREETRDVYAREIGTIYTVRVRVNNTSMLFEGTGYGRVGPGEAGVRIATKDECPTGFHPALLAFTLITGQADIHACSPDIENPFQKTRGAYKAMRTLTLDDNLGHLWARYEISPMDDEGRRTAKFEIGGETYAPKIKSIRPAFEVWVPNGPGKIRGHFTMVWVTEDESYVKGEVDTDYALDGVEIVEPLYRRIEFGLEMGPRFLRQDETIVLFSEATKVGVAA